MTSNDRPTFFSRTPDPLPDNPLSLSGRFGRLSFISWYAFLNILAFFASAGMSIAAGIFSLHTLSLDSHFAPALNGAAGIGFMGLFALYVYFHIVLTARRLHDCGRSGWYMLLLLFPVINILLVVYLLLAAGDAGANAYGWPRPAAVWEKLLAWIMIFLTALSLFAGASLISFMMGSGQIETPQEAIQKGTQYF